MVSLQEGPRVSHDGAVVTAAHVGNQQDEVDEGTEGAWQFDLLAWDLHGP